MKRIVVFLFLVIVPTLALAAQGLTVSMSMDQEVFPVGTRSTGYLKVGLVGNEAANTDRPALNVAIVLDRSGSMDGEKLEQAKEAAKYAVSLLTSRDIVSIITYDNEVQVVLPATRAGETARIHRQIDRIHSGGSTALFAGVSQGAFEVRKFLEDNQVNRVVLLSDGLANVGPDSPGELADLGASLRRQGMSVTTIGLGTGYNEDLMARLAASSDGNHAFVENPKDLVRIFDAEFQDAMSISASDVEILLECAPGVRPIRVMNREGEIRGQRVAVDMSQVLSSQEKYILVELELPEGAAGADFSVATAEIRYRNLAANTLENRNAAARISFSADQSAVQASVRADVKEPVILQLATETAEEAVRLRDAGRGAEARALLESNSLFLDEAAGELASPALQGYAEQNRAAAEEIEEEGDWESLRKEMVDDAFQNRTQQSY